MELTLRAGIDAGGNQRYCYVDKDGDEAPTLRLKPGDLLVLTLKNEAPLPAQAMKEGMTVGMSRAMSMGPSRASAVSVQDVRPGDMRGACAGGVMTSATTNLHFHGLTVPPVCHQDDVLMTMVQPGAPPFEYRFQIPGDEPPGLYWYHPHVHGFSTQQVLGGASGALIVEGMERTNPELAGLRERILIVRDQNLLNPDAVPGASGTVLPPVILDGDGDVLNTGTGTGKPSKDLSINFVPVPYPDYSPAVLKVQPGQRQLWRVLNASAITYVNLQLVADGQPQPLGVVALDGVPINTHGIVGNKILWQDHLGIPPGGRMELVMKGLPLGSKASLVTRSVNTGPAGENDPVRPLLTIVSTREAPEPAARLAQSPSPLAQPSRPWIGSVEPVRTRKLYFSENQRDPSDPNSPTDFYITIEGQTPKLFDPTSSIPDIIVQQGDVEDWIIENRTRELHAFHIHQIHFKLLQWFGFPVDEPFLRDVVDVPFWDGTSKAYPLVKLRMDFRDPNTVGTFVYHCHLLEHEDGGMMGLIRVDPREKPAPSLTTSRQ